MSRSLLVVSGVLAALAAVLLRMVAGPPGLGWYLLAWALFAAALWLARRMPEQRLGALVVAGGVTLAATGLAAPPSSSTDSFRYAWDGRVQAAGISPYDHPPSDPALAGLRDEWLFPSGCGAPDLRGLPDGGCTRINRPTEPTIYPPVAQGYFLLVHWLSPEGSRHKALQLGGWVMAVLVLVALCRLAGARRAAYWAWCPAVPVEAVNNAHVDMLGVLLVVLAFGAVRAGPARGALLGAAVAAKLLPVTALPGALSGVLANGVPAGGVPAGGVPAGGVAWRRVLGAVVPAGLVVALSYLPYVLASGASVVGYLPGYLKEERYDGPDGGNRYAILRLVMPDSWAPYAAIALLGLVVLLVLRYGDADRPWQGALLVSGSLLLLLTPGYSWYALLVVALAAMDGRWEWLGVALAGAVAYTAGPAAPGNPGTPFYVAAALAVLIGWAARRPHRAELRH
ncbi:glycosyltransferase 87 family protein [Nonomuraea glycinis]|uniref:glycosyltransferase 87 family protein n=1 Tax=Nonomuraea glycinis TaxID=2047744 RepID=UPI0016638D28|nr:glycosyltransferase 87 family protein [Nonomuraea glycinis]MCA2180300.1 glycosyltransferase 87 family protein [Nonomuraea glycinis]